MDNVEQNNEREMLELALQATAPCERIVGL